MPVVQGMKNFVRTKNFGSNFRLDGIKRHNSIKETWQAFSSSSVWELIICNVQVAPCKRQRGNSHDLYAIAMIKMTCFLVTCPVIRIYHQLLHSSLQKDWTILCRALEKCVLQKPAIINAHVWSFNFSEQIIFHVYFNGWASENMLRYKNFPIYGTNVHLYIQSHMKTSLTELHSMETTTHNDRTYYASVDMWQRSVCVYICVSVCL